MTTPHDDLPGTPHGAPPPAPLRFGLLGTGPWAHATHAPALDAHPGVEFAGVWGRRPEAAAELADRFGIRAHSDVDALLADCDAVAVALPPDIQAPLAVRAAEAGCHLLLDKPVATTPGGAAEVAAAAERAGVASVVFFTLRFSPTTAGWIDARAAAGDWLLGRADWLSPVFGGADSPYAASPWRKEKGALWDVGPHALSVLLPVLGDVADVAAVAGPGDTVHLTLRHHGGASSTVTVSHTVPPGAAGVTAEVRGPAGVAVLPEREEPPAESFGHALDALLRAVRTGTPDACDLRFGVRVTEILAGAEAALGAVPGLDTGRAAAAR
ncbi:Gfo/Idh/MocA family oxidoreductase [Streptomyces sp. DSM 42041]|uniref:Gfo/Idh/MocA family oxidoreductase n=1 Tax=Streptomyces hazeniae TaxID=3075538 RepID=A0ABU2NUE7_9ACTN|nr:Gfo/Idh/MocA family oxidoreductase [Streptomyces sp. DSM 42041]MDT0379607.1 Gfo/Idh/MocA family oxidoreductase [Streptomyces sp. DSM 42041]